MSSVGSDTPELGDRGEPHNGSRSEKTKDLDDHVRRGGRAGQATIGHRSGMMQHVWNEAGRE
jgi:hypothetical protein